jgi:hypothetical protein
MNSSSAQPVLPATAALVTMARENGDSVKDAQGSVQGRIRWRRFAAVIVPSAVVTGAILVGMANGAIAAQISIAGPKFKISASRLDGTGFVQYGGFTKTTRSDGTVTQVPVVYSGIASADLSNLCQSVRPAGLPVSMIINAGGGGKPAHAETMLIALTDLSGDATFSNINIGQDAGTLDAAGSGVKGDAGGFGQQAEHVVIDNLHQESYSTTAATFRLTGLHLFLDVGANPKECF